MILFLCIFLFLTPVRFARSGVSPIQRDNGTIKSQILEHVDGIKSLLEDLEKDELQRLEQLRTTGIWVPWNSSKKGLPEGFVIGGSDNDGWYGVVIRANYSGNLIPGKYNPDAHTAFVSYNGKENGISTDFEVLTHNNYIWSKNVYVTETLIEGGHENGQKTYICKVIHLNQWVCGKLIGDTCKVPWGGDEYEYMDWVALQLRN